MALFQNDYEEKHGMFKLKNTLKKYEKAVYKLNGGRNANY